MMMVFALPQVFSAGADTIDDEKGVLPSVSPSILYVQVDNRHFIKLVGENLGEWTQDELLEAVQEHAKFGGSLKNVDLTLHSIQLLKNVINGVSPTLDESRNFVELTGMASIKHAAMEGMIEPSSGGKALFIRILRPMEPFQSFGAYSLLLAINAYLYNNCCKNVFVNRDPREFFVQQKDNFV